VIDKTTMSVCFLGVSLLLCFNCISQDKNKQAEIDLYLADKFCNCMIKHSIKESMSFEDALMDCDHNILNSTDSLFLREELVLKSLWPDSSMNSIDFFIQQTAIGQFGVLCGSMKSFTQERIQSIKQFLSDYRTKPFTNGYQSKSRYFGTAINWAGCFNKGQIELLEIYFDSSRIFNASKDTMYSIRKTVVNQPYNVYDGEPGSNSIKVDFRTIKGNLISTATLWFNPGDRFAKVTRIQFDMSGAKLVESPPLPIKK
jgi:hypothetical protein